MASHYSSIKILSCDIVGVGVNTDVLLHCCDRVYIFCEKYELLASHP